MLRNTCYSETNHCQPKLLCLHVVLTHDASIRGYIIFWNNKYKVLIYLNRKAKLIQHNSGGAAVFLKKMMLIAHGKTKSSLTI